MKQKVKEVSVVPAKLQTRPGDGGIERRILKVWTLRYSPIVREPLFYKLKDKSMWWKTEPPSECVFGAYSGL